MATSCDLTKYVYKGQAWNLLRSFLLWHIWTERCSKKYTDQEISVCRILSSTWISTLYAGMAVWKHFHSVVKNLESLAGIEAAFSEEWILLFCFSDDGVWHFLVPPIFQ